MSVESVPTSVVIVGLDGVARTYEVRDGAAEATSMRRFYFNRTVDVSGTSGTGAVAEGVQFSDGRVAVRWVTNAAPSSTVVYDSIDDAEAIHGHGGNTEIVWIDGS